MSNFFVVVILPQDTQDTASCISQLIAPYYAWLEVPEYDTACACDLREAYDYGRSVANREVGDGSQLRDAYWALPAEERYYDDYWSEYKRVMDQAARSHPEYDKRKPDPKCNECRGTGSFKSTYNRNGQWDGWSISNRFELAPNNELPTDFCPKAIVTPDGQWHQRSKETKAAYDQWEQDAAKLLATYSDKPAMVIQCHG